MSLDSFVWAPVLMAGGSGVSLLPEALVGHPGQFSALNSDKAINCPLRCTVVWINGS